MIYDFVSQGQPKVITRDGLPYCERCDGEENLCDYHKKQVRIGIGTLRTPMLYLAARDISDLIASKKNFGDGSD